MKTAAQDLQDLQDLMVAKAKAARADAWAAYTKAGAMWRSR